mmetsp:Transcript_23544/g.26115  ORF Transcript_23544/g.26115 Transcript_23544/m.26115 type:complete len:429 (+) Transcript_23544:45-1331(+)
MSELPVTLSKEDELSLFLEKCQINKSYGTLKSGDIVASFPECRNFPRLIFKQAIPVNLLVSHGQLRDLMRFSSDDKWIYFPITNGAFRLLIKINRLSGELVVVHDLTSDANIGSTSLHAIDVNYGYVALITSRRLVILSEDKSEVLFHEALEGVNSQINGVTLCNTGKKVFIYVAVNSGTGSVLGYEICPKEGTNKISLRNIQNVASGHLSAAISFGGPKNRSVNICLDGFKQPWIGERKDDGTLVEDKTMTLDYTEVKSHRGINYWSMMSSWDPTGDMVAIGCESSGYHVISKALKKIIHKLPSGQVRCLKFSPNPSVPILALQHNQLRIVETDNWSSVKLDREVTEGPGGHAWRRFNVNSLTWNRDGTKLLVAFLGCIVEYSVLIGVPTLCDICVTYVRKNIKDAEKYGWRMDILPPDLAESCTSI